MNIGVALGGLLLHSVCRTGRVLGDENQRGVPAAPGDGAAGDGQSIGGLLQHDLCVHVHTRQQLVCLIDSDGDRVGGDPAGRGARNRDLGDCAGKGLALHRVCGDLDRLPHLHCGDVQLIDAQGHLQITQIIDGTQGLAGFHGVAGLVFLINDGAADGGGDGVVLQLLLGVLHRQLRVSQAVRRVLKLVLQIVPAQGDQCLSLGNGTALRSVDRGDGAAGAGRDCALGLISKGPVSRAAQAVDRGRGHLRRTESAGILHGDGYLPGYGIACAHHLAAGDCLYCPAQCLKGAVQRHLRGLAHIERSGVLGGEWDSQRHGAVVTDSGDGLSLADLIPLFYLQGIQCTGGICLDRLILRRALIAALGLIQRDLRLFDVSGCVITVDLIEYGIRLYGFALLKISGEYLPFDKGGHGIGIGRLEGPAAGERVGDCALGDTFFRVADCRRRRPLNQQKFPGEGQKQDCGYAQDQPPLSMFWFR